MRKFYACTVLLLSLSTICLGQSVSPQPGSPQAKPYGPGKFNIGIDGSQVIGAYSDTYTHGLGFSAKYEIPVNKNLYGTLSVGYESISAKSDSVSVAHYKSSYSFFPDKIGLKYCYKAHFFAEAQAGILLPAQSGANNQYIPEPIVETTFIYSFGIGYTMPKGIEAGLRYESWDESVAFKQVALRLAYRF